MPVAAPTVATPSSITSISSTPTASSANTVSMSYQAFYDALRSVYDLTASPISSVFEQYYHPTDASFEDPLVKVTNTKDVIGQFRALKAIFSKADIETHSLTVSEHHIVIVWTITYTARGTFGLLQFRMPTITNLTLTEDGSSVLQHVDHWSVHELLSNVPILSFFYNTWKPFMGKSSSVLTNFLHGYLVADKSTTGRGPEEEREATTTLMGSD